MCITYLSTNENICNLLFSKRCDYVLKMVYVIENTGLRGSVAGQLGVVSKVILCTESEFSQIIGQ